MASQNSRERRVNDAKLKKKTSKQNEESERKKVNIWKCTRCTETPKENASDREKGEKVKATAQLCDSVSHIEVEKCALMDEKAF